MPEKAIDIVWSFREKYSKHWATPGLVTSLRFAFTEIAEAVDAWIRSNETQYSRNNQKSLDVLDELADCAIMLLTALGPEDEIDDEPMRFSTSLESIAEHVARAMKRASEGAGIESIRNLIAVAYCEVMSTPGMSVELIKGRLDRIYKKHILPKVQL